MSYVLRERTEKEAPAYPTGDGSGSAAVKNEFDLVKPATDFIAPSSSFFFAPQPQRSSFMMYLPSKNVADSLLEHYWTAVHTICRVVHRPTFERQWVSFWQQIQTGIEPPASLQALVMGALLSSVVSLSDQAIEMQLGVSKMQLLQSFQQGAESALYRANFLRTTKLMTLQALVMYLIPLCRREVTRAHSALTGTAIRLAECMGLHRDGTHYGLSPVEVHVRRIVWHQLCFLDMRTCEATGPRPQIHQDDFDTKLPLNVNDIDLESENPPTEDSDQWTDMTPTLMRFEVNEMQRYAWRERIRLENKKTSLTHALRRVQDFVTRMDKKYLPMLNRPEPLAKMTLLVYKCMSLKLHVMLLHRYMSGHGKKMPERLRKILLNSALQQTECAITIETDPSLRMWAWYIGALHQYHSSLILLSETYASSIRYNEDRIWKCLDFVFNCQPNLTRKEKARIILTEIAQKTEVYSSLRRVRAPQEMENAMARTAAAARPPYKTVQQSIVSTVQSTPSPPVVKMEGPPIGSPPTDVQFGGWIPNMNEQATYALAAPSANVGLESSVSPKTSGSESTAEVVRGKDERLSSSTSPPDPMVDVDWNEWDKMFPPDVNLSDFGNLPDFQFSTLLPNSTL
ncbi:hypothetical protein, variant [Verruconis gallopava]|nr:hypothetical protein, variant [Verruconis gallopava]KIW02865.1 hypothetical protein, variant [Verruconis gallopava]